MARDALTRLVEDANRLPMPVAPESEPGKLVLPRSADRRHRRRIGAYAVEPEELKTRVRELLFELSRRVDAALGGTLERASAWDQIDSVRVVDRAVEEELVVLQQSARQLQEDEASDRRALGLEAQLTLDAALGLVSLVEKRLATLIRLRLRTGEEDLDPDASEQVAPDQQALLPEGRPFLDLGAALHETARRWV